MSPLKCPNCRLSLPPNWGGSTHAKGKCPYCGKPLGAVKDVTPTPSPVAVHPPSAAGAKTILWGAGAANLGANPNELTPKILPTAKEKTPPPVHVSASDDLTPRILPTYLEKNPPPVHVSASDELTPRILPAYLEKTPPPVHVSASDELTPRILPAYLEKTPPPVHVSTPGMVTPRILPTAKDKTPSPVRVSTPGVVTPRILPTAKNKTSPPVRVSTPGVVTPRILPTAKDKTPPPAHVPTPGVLTPGNLPTAKDKTPSPVRVSEGIAPTIEAPAIHRDALPHKPIGIDSSTAEDVVFTPSVVVGPKAPVHSLDSAAPILAVLAASQELSLSDVEPASSEHAPQPRPSRNPAEEITMLNPSISDDYKNVPDWIVSGNESFGFPEKSKVGLYVSIGLGLFIVAGIIFFVARGKEKPTQVAQAPVLEMPRVEPKIIPEAEPTPTPAVAPKPTLEPAPIVQAAPVEKPAPIAKPDPKPAVAEEPKGKAVVKVMPPTTKPARIEKPVVNENPVAVAKTIAKVPPAPKAEVNSSEKNNDEKFQKATEAYKRGNTKFFQGNLVEAIADFKLAIRLNPKEPVPYRGLGLALAQQGKTAEAVKNLKRYITTAPKASDRALIEKRIQQLQ